MENHKSCETIWLMDNCKCDKWGTVLRVTLTLIVPNFSAPVPEGGDKMRGPLIGDWPGLTAI